MNDFLAYTSVTALMITGLLLIFIVLLQRGRGGGLAGALGGAGGQSALGTKAGDVFTKITIVLATIWILLACLSIYALRGSVESKSSGFVNDAVGQEESGTASAIGDAPETEEAAETDTPPSSSDANSETPADTASPPPSDGAAATTGGPSLGTPPDAAAEAESDAEPAPATEEPVAEEPVADEPVTDEK